MCKRISLPEGGDFPPPPSPGSTPGYLSPVGLLGVSPVSSTLPTICVCLCVQMCGQRCAKGSFPGVSVFIRENVGVGSAECVYVSMFLYVSMLCV